MSSTGRRIGAEEALHLLREEPLGSLMARAHQERLARHANNLVSFVLDTNPNYSNICTTRCRFCAFWRAEHHEQAFTLTPAELAERVSRAAELGATTVLLQGGHNPRLGLAEWLGYLGAIRAACPAMHLHPFSPPEIIDLARREGMSLQQVLRRLQEQGVHTIPGGGAEILSDRVRHQISPGKCSSEEWLEVMATAHELGFTTTATMMYGHLETDQELIGHLLALRRVQDRTGGFSSFIPWSFKPGSSPLTEQVPVPAHPARYVRIIALARLVLDNFAHIQSSWFSESITAGQLGLLAGADDLGGLLVEEHVLRETGFERSTTLAQLLQVIRDAGFQPVRRDSDYRIVEQYPAACDPGSG